MKLAMILRISMLRAVKNRVGSFRGASLFFASLAFIFLAEWVMGAEDAVSAGLPSFERIAIDSHAEDNSHKPKVLARFSTGGLNDIGSLDREGFKLYRYAEHWKPYVIFAVGDPAGYEDAVTADINGDGSPDIILGDWSYRTLWAENPAGRGADPYRTQWKVHVVGSGHLSHEVCAADMNRDGKCDIVTTAGIFFQGANPDVWRFVEIGKGGQGTTVGNVLANGDGYADVIAVYQSGGTNELAWFENPGHTGGDPVTGHWAVHVIDPQPGQAHAGNRDMDELAIACGDINHDGHPDVIMASMGEGPDSSNDPRQIGDGLVWYQAPAHPRTEAWVKHIIDGSAGWVHASSIKLADFDGDGHLDVCYGEQDQSGPTPNAAGGGGRRDGVPSPRLVICYNLKGDGTAWKKQVLSQFPEIGSGGFNSKVGIIGSDSLPSIVTSLHGFFSSANPVILWRNHGVPARQKAASR